MPCTATGPCSSCSSTGVPTSETSVRRWMPASSMSRELNPSRWAESWLPLVSTAVARDRSQADQRLVGQPHGVDGRQRPVVDVAGDDDEVDALRLDHVQQVVDERGLVAEHPLSVERPAEMPV